MEYVRYCLDFPTISEMDGFEYLESNYLFLSRQPALCVIDSHLPLFCVFRALVGLDISMDFWNAVSMIWETHKIPPGALYSRVCVPSGVLVFPMRAISLLLVIYPSLTVSNHFCFLGLNWFGRHSYTNLFSLCCTKTYLIVQPVILLVATSIVFS